VRLHNSLSLSLTRAEETLFALKLNTYVSSKRLKQPRESTPIKTTLSKMHWLQTVYYLMS